MKPDIAGHDRTDRIDNREMVHLVEHPGAQMPYKGFDIRFTGWRSPYNQLVEFGAWIATRKDWSGYHFATTLGMVGYIADMLGPFDMTPANGESPTLQSASLDERMAAASRALVRLCKNLDEIVKAGG